MYKGVLAVWNDVDPEVEEDYEAWYQQDHLRDRLGVPGFRTARRHRRSSGLGRQYFTFYAVDSLDVLASPAYVERLRDVTDWTQRIMPHFRHLIRAACAVALDMGNGTAGTVGTVLLDGIPADARQPAREAVAAVFAGLLQDPCITRARLWECSSVVTNVENPEADIRPDPPRTSELSILIEGTSERAIQAGMATLASLPAFGEARPVMEPSLYRLLFSSQD